MSQIEKQCVLCGQSCAGQPRIKNEQGQYAHQECVKAKQESRSAQTAGSDGHAAALDGVDAEYDGLDDVLGLDDGMLDDAMLGDLPVQDDSAAGAMRTACPGCGQAMTGGAVLCMSCGYDTRSGKAMKTKVGKAPKQGGTLASSAAAQQVTSGLGYLGGSLIGATVAAALGALIWGGLIAGLKIEMSWIAIIVGILSGFGAVMGARGESGAMTGLIACVACLVAICAGKYYGMQHLADEYLNDMQIEESTYFADLNKVEREEYAMAIFVDDILRERLDAGVPDEQTAADYEELLEIAWYPDDEYPKDVVNEARARWRQTPEEEQVAFFDREQAEYDAELQASLDFNRDELYEEGFLASFGLFDFVFFGFGLFAAFKVGTGAGID